MAGPQGSQGLADVPGGLEHLAVVRDQVRDELRRADTKATTLLSLVGATLAGVVALSGRQLPVAANVALWLAAVPIAASVLLLLSSIRPRLSAVPVPGSWLDAARSGPATLLETCATTGAMSTADHVCRLARAAKTKYQRIATAVALLVIGLGGIAIALVLAGVTT